jgi:HAMP domain-containing protein
VTLRRKLFVLIGALLAAMVGAEWLLIETLTRDLRVEVGAVATSVGKDIVRILRPGAEPLETARAEPEGLRRIVIRDEAHLVGEEARVLALPGGKDVKVETRIEPAPPGGREGEPRVERFVVTTVETGADGKARAKARWTASEGTGFLFIEGPAARTRIPIPGAGVRVAVTRFRTRLLLGSLGIVGVGLLAAAFVAHRVTRPLVELSRAARTVGEGAFGAQVAAREGGEVGEANAA